MSEEVKKEEVKRFSINVGDETKPETLFTFSGPEGSNLGVIYSVCHRIMMHTLDLIKKEASALAPKTEEELPEKEESKDIKA